MAASARAAVHRKTCGDPGRCGGRQGRVLGQTGGLSVGKPLKIAIPQYAYYREGGKRTPAIVVQAEEAQGIKMVGARLADGKGVVDLLENFQLLGKVPPKTGKK